MSARWIGLAVILLGFAMLPLLGAELPPQLILGEIFRQSMGSTGAWSGTLKEMLPLLICGIGVFLALRAGLFNIGIEGQFMMGALAGAAIAIQLPGALGMISALVGGACAGALWAFPAGWIRAFRNGHEVITTIMLNEVAKPVSTALMAGPLKGPYEVVQTAEVQASTQIAFFGGEVRISLGLVIGMVLLVLMTIWLKRTVKGYELQAVGANPHAAELAGINGRLVQVRSMAASGALGGFGGALHVLAYEHRCYEGFSSGYGFDSLGVALLAGSHPLAMVASALGFGALKQGVGAVGALYEVPKGVGLLLLGLLMILFATLRYRRPGGTP